MEVWYTDYEFYGGTKAMQLSQNVIVAATQNRHKIREIQAITDRFGMKIIGRDEAGIPPFEIEEDGDSFEENSFKKAFEIMKLCGRPTIADDSGLEVDCIEGAPGIYSARFAAFDGLWPQEDGQEQSSKDEDKGKGRPKADSDDKENNRKLRELLKAFPYEERTGRFVSVISMAFPDRDPIICRGTVEGHILTEERGDGGFGYDPMFIPKGYDETFGELPAELKNSISHRANALKKLEKELADHIPG